MQAEKMFTIAEVAQQTGISPDTLRYYEQLGLLSVARNENNYRAYAQHDIQWIAFLMRLKATGMPLKDMQELILLKSKGDSTIPQRKAIMERHKQRVLQRLALLQDELKNLDAKIDYYCQLQI